MNCCYPPRASLTSDDLAVADCVTLSVTIGRLLYKRNLIDLLLLLCISRLCKKGIIPIVSEEKTKTTN